MLHAAHCDVLQGGDMPLLAGRIERPSCLCCRAPQHYIGCADTDVFCDDLPLQSCVLLFYCPDCRVQCCIEAAPAAIALDGEDVEEL